MISWAEIFSYSLGGAMLFMMTLGIVISAFIPAIDRWSRRYLVTLFSLLLPCVVVCFIDIFLYADPGMAAWERVICFLQLLFLPVLMFMPTIFLLHSCGESIKNSVLFRVVIILCGAYCCMLILAQFTEVFYYITPENQIIRSPLIPLLLAPLAVIMLLNIDGVIRRRKKLKKRYFIALLIYLPPMTISVFIHMFIMFSIFLVLGMALYALTMFGLIIADNVEQNLRQQREIANQRASVMVLQMRPHFIYNTLMGIYYLCDQDPGSAKRVTLDFTTYLRKNFTAIASEDTIPFQDELEHTRAYLAVEQAQFEDSLFVRFDAPHTMFRVPPLTLQPIVENAVKHGMKSCSDPLHISVVTRQTDTASEIIVEDDGPGFGPVDDDAPHIALSNIRQRLALMCKGKLTIAPREGRGTSVKVTIPISGN